MKNHRCMNESLGFTMCFGLLVIVSVSGCVSPLPKTDSDSFSAAISGAVPSFATDNGRRSRCTSAELCANTARQMESNGHLSEAIQLYLRAIEYGNQDFRIHHRLGVLYGQAKDPIAARKHFEKAIGSNPSDACLNNDFGFFCLTQGELERAESLFQAVLQSKPKDVRAVNNLSKLHVRMGRPDLAFQLMEKVHGPAVAHSNIGVLLAEHGDRNAAQSHFQQAAAISTDLQTPPAFLNYFAGQQPDQSPP